MRDFKLQQKYQELGLKPKEIKYRQYQRKYYEIMKQRRLTRKINRKVRKSGDKKAPKRNSESRLNSLSSSSGSSDDSSNDESLEPIRKKRLIVSLEFDSPKVEEKKQEEKRIIVIDDLNSDEENQAIRESPINKVVSDTLGSVVEEKSKIGPKIPVIKSDQAVDVNALVNRYQWLETLIRKNESMNLIQ